MSDARGLSRARQAESSANATVNSFELMYSGHLARAGRNRVTTGPGGTDVPTELDLPAEPPLRLPPLAATDEAVEVEVEVDDEALGETEDEDVEEDAAVAEPSWDPARVALAPAPLPGLENKEEGDDDACAARLSGENDAAAFEGDSDGTG